MTTDILISPVDGLKLSLMYVAPEGAPKGIVQIVHGMCEHKERYIPFMLNMAYRTPISEGLAKFVISLLNVS